MGRRAIFALGVSGFLTLFGNASLSQRSTPSAQDLSPRDLAALNQLREQPTWLFPADACPADVMPATERKLYYYPKACKADLVACAADCRAEDANACYALALAIQALKTDDPISEALFLRACRLGISSGCTNRAAGMTNAEAASAEAYACAARTFAQTCRRNDPWGCTMYGFHLMHGAGVQKDLGLAAQMLRRACRYDETFIACTNAKRLLKEIEAAQGPQPESPD